MFVFGRVADIGSVATLAIKGGCDQEHAIVFAGMWSIAAIIFLNRDCSVAGEQ